MKHKWLEFVPIYALVLLLFATVAVFMDHTVTAMSETNFQKNHSCIVIDAGHGGIDGGATSYSGVVESKLNLDIALRLNDLLHFLGYETKMIRTSDISIHAQGDTIASKKISDLKERVRIVNEIQDAILISIHQNYFQESRYSGAQVFYAQTAGSEILAKELQNLLKATIDPANRRKAKQSTGVYLMEHIQCSGILIECGFLSNPEEDRKLQDPSYQKNLCCVIAAAVAGFVS